METIEKDNQGHASALVDPSDTNSDDNVEQQRDEVQEIEKSARKESNRLQSWRYALSLLLLMTSGVTGATYFFLVREEKNSFEIAFDQFARTLTDAAIEQQRNLRDGLAAICHVITASSQSQDAEWPRFHMEHFELYAKDFMKLTRSEYVGVNNVVKFEERELFLNYTGEHHEHWIEESHLLKYGNLEKLINDTGLYRDFIYKKKTGGGWEPDLERDIYFARTTQSPPPRSFGPLTNFNIGSLGANDAVQRAAIEMKNEALITIVKPFQALPPDEHQGYHTDDNADNPHSFVYHPVRRFVDNQDSEVVATVNAAFAWDASMRFLLPRNVNGIICVIYNSCEQFFSYKIDGEEAYYLGEGDHHDSRYDNMKFDVNLSLHTHPNFTSYPAHCLYRLSVYPSGEFEDEYRTNLPLIFVVVVTCTFALVALVFCLYDLNVKRRNDKIVQKAATANELVASFFPGNMRDRVLEENELAPSKNEKPNTHNVFELFLNEDKDESKRKSISQSSAPLADYFPATTIMFADISGFTKWSASRKPDEVFTLLEGIYASLDANTQRRRVLKIETVGDCYVAVTGVPDPNPNHAVDMARFACDAQLRIQHVVTELSETLGNDTTQLRFRIGIHSGSVVGGVLRTRNARFQLFGDSMNTAARLESSGVPGSIHLSQQAADELVARGYEAWVSPREETVVAKGKGEMQTYWLNRFQVASGHTLSEKTNGTSIVSSEP